MQVQDKIKDIKAMAKRGAQGEENYYTPERIAWLVEQVGQDRADKIVARYNAQKGIYQKRRINGKIETVKYNFYTYNTIRTTARGVCRDKFQAGMTAWKALTDEEKQEWHKKAQGHRMTACNMFLHCYMLDLI